MHVPSLSTFGALAAGALMALGLAGTASAENCPRSFLDKAYCDYDGDLVADLPLDEK